MTLRGLKLTQILMTRRRSSERSDGRPRSMLLDQINAHLLAINRFVDEPNRGVANLFAAFLSSAISDRLADSNWMMQPDASPLLNWC
jgi:hypothetical protein